jgi:predicted nuclease of predicted toxin-antitoxin system
MRLILNENISSSVAQLLRALGHDVLAVKESMRGESDANILARAQAELRLVVTQDKDFGELAFRIGLPADCGIVLFRLSGSDPLADNQRIVEVINSRTDWAGHFAVADAARIRIRPLPSVSPPAP